MTPPTDRGKHCPTCGQFAARAAELDARHPGDPVTLEAQYRALDARNAALSKVCAVQAKRLVAQIESEGHFAPMERTA